jgi:hypothetical protein
VEGKVFMFLFTSETATTCTGAPPDCQGARTSQNQAFTSCQMSEDVGCSVINILTPWAFCGEEEKKLMPYQGQA